MMDEGTRTRSSLQISDELARQLRDEGGAVARVRIARALESRGAHDESRLGKQQFRRAAFRPCREDAAGMDEQLLGH